MGTFDIPYQGRRRAYPRSFGDRWILAGLVTLALLALVALAVIVANGPQRPHRAPTGLPGTVAVPSMVDGDATDPPAPDMSPSSTPSPSPAPSPAAPSPAAASPVRQRPVPRPPVVPTSSPPWTASYEAEAQTSVWRWHAWVGPMAGASGGQGVYGLGRPSMGMVWFQVSVPRAGTYTVSIRYQNPDADPRFAFVGVDRTDPVPVRFPATGGGCVRGVSLTVTLDSAGVHGIGLNNPYGTAPDLDRIVLTAAG